MDYDPEPARIDPRLVKHFALFREPGPGPGGPLDPDEFRRVEQVREMVDSGRVPPLTARGLDFDQVRKVALDSDRVMLVIPGATGIHVLVRSSARGVSYAAGAKVAGRIDGLPMMSVGTHLIGLAVDGVDRHPVEFRDGSTGYAVVRDNAYTIEDPSGERKKVAPPVRRF